MNSFQPFANDSQSVSVTSAVGDLTFENQGEQVNLYGNASFFIDRESLELARVLQQKFADMVAYLEKNGAMDIEHSQTIANQQANITEVENPFL